jgi:hypothetical protein
MSIRSTRMSIEKLFKEDILMETIFYTLQDYYTHTKAISYLLMIAALIGFALFWKFISAKDDADK